MNFRLGQDKMVPIVPGDKGSAITEEGDNPSCAPLAMQFVRTCIDIDLAHGRGYRLPV